MVVASFQKQDSLHFARHGRVRPSKGHHLSPEAVGDNILNAPYFFFHKIEDLCDLVVTTFGQALRNMHLFLNCLGRFIEWIFLFLGDYLCDKLQSL